MLGYIISDKNEINVENYEIQSFDILHKTDLNIYVIENNKVLYKNNIINNASENGHIQVLEWFKNSGYEFKYDNYAISYASKSGNIKVLEWFKNSGYEFKYDVRAINWASDKGNIKVLEWFKNSKYEFKYSEWAINNASMRGHVEVLEWFKNSGYKFKYGKGAIYWPSIYTQSLYIQILKFYSNNINIKKLIKWSKKIIFINTIKFKTNNKYLKGYQKN
jgi:hypothetical protein